MRRLLGLSVLLPLVAACSDVQMLGATVVEQRRVMNDMQARANMAAVCDISLGAYFRELNELERRYAGLVCGDVVIMQAPLPEQLVAAE
jgi:Na+-transporting NADH:ubiquinone oxidoreductase subunit NqrD